MERKKKTKSEIEQKWPKDIVVTVGSAAGEIENKKNKKKKKKRKWQHLKVNYIKGSENK